MVHAVKETVRDFRLEEKEMQPLSIKNSIIDDSADELEDKAGDQDVGSQQLEEGREANTIFS